MKQTKSLIRKLGGARIIADFLNVDVSTVYRWTYPRRNRKGTGGIIPYRHHSKLIELSKKANANIPTKDFINYFIPTCHERYERL